MRSRAAQRARRAGTTSTGSAPSGSVPDGEFEELIRSRIARRLGRRVRDLSVAVQGGVIRLSGECSTFYSKQLAQHAVLGVVEDEVIENRIRVTACPV